MSENSEFLEDITGDLARALRKSWSEPQDSRILYRDSPISTPQYNQYHNISPGGDSLTSGGSQVTSFTGGSDNTNATNFGYNSPDYHLIKRHYSLMEQPSSGNNGNRGSASPSADLLEEEIMQESLSPLMPAPVSMPLRRSSMQEIQRVRHLLNPRSSFSGVPSEEPDLPQRPSISWVTILAGSSPEFIEPVLVLDESLQSVHSKYGLCVVHDSQIDSSKIREKGIETVAFDKENLPKLFNKDLNPHSILMLFMALIGKYDLVCYLSPTCMVLESIDDILSTEEVSKKIDNDTCVLLTNPSPDPQIVVLRPLADLEMCIKEFFTVYCEDSGDRSSKLTKMRDYDVLTTLFQDSWCKFATDGYCGTLLEESTNSEAGFPHKMVDLKLQKPWMMQENQNMGPLTTRWHQLWLKCCK